MQRTKSALQLQSEIRLMRLAYEEREARSQRLNQYLTSPVEDIVPHIAICAAVITAILIGCTCLL